MSCNIVISQQTPIPVSHKIAPEAKKRGKKSHKNYMEKLKERFLKDNQMVQKTLKNFLKIYRLFQERFE